jgi:uncharacterized membrane protein
VIDVIDQISRRALMLTFIFFGLITVLPFTTSLLSAHVTDHSVMILYLAHELAIAVTLTLILEVCGARGHTRKGASLRSLRIKLTGISATLAACIVLAAFADLRWVIAAPLVIALIEKLFRSHDAKVRKQESLR